MLFSRLDRVCGGSGFFGGLMVSVVGFFFLQLGGF